jgi:hypothetical protein
MRSAVIYAMLGLLVLPALAAGATRPVPSRQITPADLPRVNVLSSDDSGLRLVFDLPALAVDTVRIVERAFRSVAIPGGGLAGDIGQPGIPTFTRLIAIPDGAGVSVRAVAEDVEELSGYDLMPVQDNPGEDLVLDAAAYARDGFGDAPLADAGQPALVRHLRVVPLTIQPVQYNPARGTIRVAGRLRVEVRFDGSDSRNVARSAERSIPSSFDRIYRQLVVNYAEPPQGTRIESGTWLVICPNDPGVISRLQPLLDWRKRKGFPARLVTTVETGPSSTQIKNYIQAAYDLWSDPPEFIVLAGDASGTYVVPTWYEPNTGGEGDFPYTQLEGDDLLSDAHVGRLSFNTLPELETIVAKIVGYESNPFLNDPGWFTRACLVGDPGASGYSTVQVMQWIKTRLRQLGYTQIDTVFSGDFPSQMSTALNRGDTIFSYRGTYGMSGWTNTHTSALMNGWKMPFVMASTCGTGSFASGTSISEGFLRAGTSINPKGGIGAIGTATTGTHTRFNNCLTMGVMQGLLYEGDYEMGAALTRGRLELYMNYYNSPQSINVQIFSYWNNLMGDPAAECWTGQPRQLTVGHPANLAAGANSMTVGVTEGGAPRAGVQVCLWKTSLVGAELFEVGQTDEHGTVELAFSPISTGNALLTVTDHDCRPYLYTVAVEAAPALVGFQAYAADDDMSGESSGNADGLINPGETIELRVQLRNYGTQPAGAVTARLSTDDPYVTMTDADESFGDIAAGATAWSSDDFGLLVDPGCPNGHSIRFSLDVSSGAEQWHSQITLPVVGAHFEAWQTTVIDGGNGRLDPGETAQLVVGLRNAGGETGQDVTGTLTSLSPWLAALDSTGSFGTITVGGLAENSVDRFTVHADVATYAGHLAVFRLVTRFNGGARDTTFVTLTVGERATADPIGPDSYGYMAYDNTDTSYPEAPVYSWVEVDPAYGGDGIEIPLGDYGDYADKSTGVDLPFEFTFYGETFARVTVCSNGWIAMGSTYLTDYRNWNIPGAGSPNNLLAVFWDDLYQNGASRVLRKYDSSGHRLIVEWSRMRNIVDGSIETFEAILYDPAYHVTSSGDGIILYQYQSVSNVDAVDGYSTVGIQNFDHTDGLLYSYFDRYPAGAASLQAGRAIRFVPQEAPSRGSLQGLVRNDVPDGRPIDGAVVTVLETGRRFTSGADGIYQGSVDAGTYTLLAQKVGFAPDTANGVMVLPTQMTRQDFALRDIAGPSITGVSQPQRTTDTAGPYPIQATVTDWTAVGSVSLWYRSNGGGWLELPMTGTGDVYAASIPGRSAGTQIDYYISAQDSFGQNTLAPADAPDSFYTLYIMTVAYHYEAETADPAWQLGAPGDDAASGFWIRDIPLETSYGGQIMNPGSDHTPAPGVRCFFTGNTNLGGTNPEGDVDAGCTTLISPTFDLRGATQAVVHYWRWYSLAGVPDDPFMIDISSDGGASWRSLELVQGNQNWWMEASFDLTQLITLTDRVILHFVACDLNQSSQVEAALDDFSVETFTPSTTGLPDLAVPAVPQTRAWSGPNPFSGGTTIGFRMDEPGTVSVSIYDAQGRVVRRLLDGTMKAGTHILQWDGRGDGGARLPCGVYFYRLRTGGRTEYRKLLRLE